jgi:hypothetical protein
MRFGITASIRCLACVAAASTLAPMHLGPRFAETAAARARNLVAAEVAADAGEAILSGSNLGAERDSLRIAGAELWRVDLPTDHAHPYLVAITPARVIPLAGFPTPDLYGISRMLGPVRQGVEARASVLARLADPSGGSHVVFALTPAPSHTLDSLFVRRWRAALPATWPPDTAFAVGQGAHVVVKSVLSRDERDFGQRWTAIVYRFVLSPAGIVESWARASTEPFQMPENMGALIR